MKIAYRMSRLPGIGAWPLFLILLLTGYSLAKMPDASTGMVSDFASVLSEVGKASLEAKLNAFEEGTTNEVYVVTVPSLDSIPVEEYANTLFSKWGIGQKGKDNGLLFLIAPTERKTRIEVGYGLEGVLPDGKAGRILDEVVLPKFREGDFEGGIVDGCERIMAVLSPDAAESWASEDPFPLSKSEDQGLDLDRIVEHAPILIFLLLVVGALSMALGIIILKRNLGLTVWIGLFAAVFTLATCVFMNSLQLPVPIVPGFAGAMLVLGIFLRNKLLAFWNKPASSGSSGSSSVDRGWSRRTKSSSISRSSSGRSRSGGGSSGGGGASRGW